MELQRGQHHLDDGRLESAFVIVVVLFELLFGQHIDFKAQTRQRPGAAGELFGIKDIGRFVDQIAGQMHTGRNGLGSIAGQGSAG